MSADSEREVALRIGLAARTIEGIDIREFVGALATYLGVPLTPEKLAKITVDDLHKLLKGDDAHDEDADRLGLKQAVRYLWGQDIADDGAPQAEAYCEGEMPGSLRVAVASNSGEQLDGHFGSCARFLIYQVSPIALKLVGSRATRGADAEEDRNAARAALLEGCQLLYVQSIGGPAAAKVVRAGVHPIKVPAGGAGRDVLTRLQQALQAPPPWLARVMGVEAQSLARFGAEEEAS